MTRPLFDGMVCMHTNSIFRRLTLQVLRGLHFIGQAIFFGVIVGNIAIDRFAETQGPAFLADARTLVSLSSFSLPLNGLALALVTGVAMTAAILKVAGWAVVIRVLALRGGLAGL